MRASAKALALICIAANGIFPKNETALMTYERIAVVTHVGMSAICTDMNPKEIDMNPRSIADGITGRIKIFDMRDMIES